MSTYLHTNTQHKCTGTVSFYSHRASSQPLFFDHIHARIEPGEGIRFLLSVFHFRCVILLLFGLAEFWKQESIYLNQTCQKPFIP